MREKAIGLSTLLIGLATWLAAPHGTREVTPPAPTPPVAASEVPPVPAPPVAVPESKPVGAPPKETAESHVATPAPDLTTDTSAPMPAIAATQIPQPASPPPREKKPVERDTSVAIVRSGPTDAKRVALTFDDGPHPTFTPKVLQILRERKVKATFFVLGNRVKQHPAILRRIVEEGHEVGNHTYDHRLLKAMDNALISREISETQEAIRNAIGYETSLFRPPYGEFRSDTRSVFKEHGLSVVLWNVDTRDWRSRDQERILANVTKQTRNGSIILAHDIHEATVDALPGILDSLQSRGYEFATVNELCGLPSLKLASARPATSTAQVR